MGARLPRRPLRLSAGRSPSRARPSGTATPALRARVADLDALSNLSEKDLAGQIGPDKAAAVIAYLRADPGARDIESVDAFDRPRAAEAERRRLPSPATGTVPKSLALAAYLDGFEPVEPTLAPATPSLLAEVEKGMGELRAAIADGKPAADVAARGPRRSTACSCEAEAALAPDAEQRRLDLRRRLHHPASRRARSAAHRRRHDRVPRARRDRTDMVRRVHYRLDRRAGRRRRDLVGGDQPHHASAAPAAS